MGSWECLRHEEYDHFPIGDTGVTVKVDFVRRMPDGTLVITDWKNGRDDDEYETELQIAAVQPWAGEEAFGRIVGWAGSGYALTGVLGE
ncbi:MAG: hypothetical protein Q7V05_06970 [Methanoregula sp.]|nr:hypothetical protein [Methanoregula sp.]